MSSKTTVAIEDYVLVCVGLECRSWRVGVYY
jgi:hypothetical protein